mmetsp:Transcript_17143/g.25708  ORF Transcript_17143/g.25708 Transcript_17143/m.25708 type:complete len:204 (-) Transcript_17143:364-975(-)
MRKVFLMRSFMAACALFILYRGGTPPESILHSCSFFFDIPESCNFKNLLILWDKGEVFRNFTQGPLETSSSPRTISSSPHSSKLILCDEAMLCNIRAVRSLYFCLRNLKALSPTFSLSLREGLYPLSSSRAIFSFFICLPLFLLLFERTLILSFSSLSLAKKSSLSCCKFPFILISSSIFSSKILFAFINCISECLSLFLVTP